MLTDSARPPTVPQPSLPRPAAPVEAAGYNRWPMVEDPARWRRFALEMIDAHHPVRVPGFGADQCSCGRPFMLCPIGPVAHQLLSQ